LKLFGYFLKPMDELVLKSSGNWKKWTRQENKTYDELIVLEKNCKPAVLIDEISFNWNRRCGETISKENWTRRNKETFSEKRSDSKPVQESKCYLIEDRNRLYNAIF
jgi:hypothetical protein